MMISNVQHEGSWIKVYDEDCKKVSQMSSSGKRVMNASGNTFTVKEGSWLKVYDEDCKKISQRSA